jgi:hypothetical protein
VGKGGFKEMNGFIDLVTRIIWGKFVEWIDYEVTIIEVHSDEKDRLNQF